MSFLERCPECGALVHFGKNDKCSSCKKSIPKEKRKLVEENMISEKIERRKEEKYPYLLWFLAIFEVILYLAMIGGIIGIFYGLISGDFPVAIISLYVLLSGVILFVIPAMMQVIVDIETNGRMNNKLLKQMVELFKS